MELNRHKEHIMDFLGYMRRRAKVIHINELAASLSFTTTLSLVPMVTLAFSLMAALPSFLRIKRIFQNWLADNLIPGNIADPIMVYLNQFASSSLTNVSSLVFHRLNTALTIGLAKSISIFNNCLNNSVLPDD